MDLVNRQAVINEVVAWPNNRMTDCKNEKPLIERLKELPLVQLENNWIPCSERLPEHLYKKSFLVTVKFDDYKEVMICKWSSFSKGEDGFSVPKKVKINGFTCWM